MKKLLSLICAAIIFSTSNALAFETDVTIKIAGMTCEACVNTMQKVFKKVHSVQDVNVSLDDQTILIDEKDGLQISEEKIKELIEWGGYDLLLIKR